MKKPYKKIYKYRQDFTFEGKRYSIKANTLEELYEKKAAKLQELKSEHRIYSPNTKVSEWAAVAYDTYKPSVKQLPEIKGRYKKYIDPVIGSLPICKVTPVQCQAVLNSCSGMSFSHLDKLRQELKFLFSTALDNSLVKKDPTTKLIMPDYTKGKRRSITDQEREHLYKVCEAYKPFLLFRVILQTGARPAEAMKLIGKDIDHSNRLLHIRGTKTYNSDRYVPIPSDLYEIIRYTAPFLPICPNTVGKPYNKDSYRKLRDRLKRELNLSMGTKTYRNALVPPYALADDFEPYCLRHTYCTDLCKAGVDVRTAQRLMGHANISITADIYTHVDQSQILDAAKKMEIYAETMRKQAR